MCTIYVLANCIHSTTTRHMRQEGWGTWIYQIVLNLFFGMVGSRRNAPTNISILASVTKNGRPLRDQKTVLVQHFVHILFSTEKKKRLTYFLYLLYAFVMFYASQPIHLIFRHKCAKLFWQMRLQLFKSSYARIKYLIN